MKRDSQAYQQDLWGTCGCVLQIFTELGEDPQNVLVGRAWAGWPILTNGLPLITNSPAEIGKHRFVTRRTRLFHGVQFCLHSGHALS